MARRKRGFTCVLCGTKFESSQLQVYFCSRKCSGVYSNVKKQYPNLTMEELLLKIESYKNGKGDRVYDKHGNLKYKKTCNYCGKEFFTMKKTGKFCKKECMLLSKGKKKKWKLSTRTYQKILKRAFPDWKCPFCEWKKTFNTHHVVNKQNGGNEDTMNLVMLCPNHHSEAHLPKGHKEKEIIDEDLKKL